ALRILQRRHQLHRDKPGRRESHPILPNGQRHPAEKERDHVERVPQKEAGEIRHPGERAKGQGKRWAIPEIVPMLGEILRVKVLMPDEMEERLTKNNVVVVVRIWIAWAFQRPLLN